ncbi:MAG TPA: DUF4139 domain-containing protein [Polyangiaceae bacterium]|nr:DUF4139 domain-containing protein [Polyangiaceae bacterium]
MLRKMVVCAALSGALFGCAGVRAPIQTEAALGKVVVYRNGVAYFERRALVTNGTLRLTVPADRVDDFLKSLKVTDVKTGESLPVSFKTMDAGSDETEMIIAIPGKGPRDLSVTYVTDSPAWKPSYRIVLGKKAGAAAAELEAWAVVDNVSGEDWKRVTVGVGSTSALSFRYDLHSVRMVERETLGDEAPVAGAPPIGGSPYAVASTEVPIVGALGNGIVDRLMKPDAEKKRLAEESTTAMLDQPLRKPMSAHSKASGQYPTAAPAGLAGFGVGAGATGPSGGGDDRALDRLAMQVRSQPGKVKLQGFARRADANQKDAALARANAVRDLLIQRGVPADKLEAVADGTVNEGQAIRLVADAAPAQAAQAQRPAEEAKDPIGNSYFLAGVPMTIEKDRSAMVSLMKSATKAERVYFYDPISAHGSQDYAFQAVRLENPTDYTLDRGPFTVYAEGQFLGEGLSEPIPPKSAAFIPYALDREIVVEPKDTEREEITRLVTIERGIVSAEMKHVRKTSFSLHNRGQADAKVYVRHAVPQGWDLRPTSLAMERLGGTYLFPVSVPAHGAVVVELEEDQPVQRSLDIRTSAGLETLGLYVKSTKDLPPKLRGDLEEVLALHREMADVEQHLSTLAEQMNEYRTRVDELNDQIVSLRKVRTADELARHLAKKMKEISDRLQTATIKSADLQEELMTRRIKVEDKLADLTLRSTEERVAER